MKYPNVKIARWGKVNVRDTGRLLGYVDRATHTGAPARTWRAIGDNGFVIAAGLQTRRDALQCLLGNCFGKEEDRTPGIPVPQM